MNRDPMRRKYAAPCDRDTRRRFSPIRTIPSVPEFHRLSPMEDSRTITAGRESSA
jgi:hypothetical protein